jgi:hypothetical protein
MKIDALEEMFSDMLELVLSEDDQSAFEHARAEYILEDDGSDYEGFTEWFLFNYFDLESGKTFVERYVNSHPEAEALKESFRSIFEVRFEHDQIYLKDIFTKEDFQLNGTPLNDDELVSLRIVPIDEAYEAFGDIYRVDMAYREVIEKHMMEQFNAYTHHYGDSNMRRFLDNQGQLIFKIMHAVQSTGDGLVSEEEFLLYQARYAYKNSREQVVNLIAQMDETLELESVEAGLYSVFKDNIILAELEFIQPTLYVLCNNEKHLENMTNLLKAIESEEFVFLGKDVVTLDELL